MELFACSGPGAGEAIGRNIETGYTHAAIAGGLFLLSLALFAAGLRHWFGPVVLLGLLALHPAWTISAISGDCGELKRVASFVATGLGCMAIGGQLWLSLSSRSSGNTGKRLPEGAPIIPPVTPGDAVLQHFTPGNAVDASDTETRLAQHDIKRRNDGIEPK